MYRGSCHVSVCIVTGLMCIMTGFVCTTTGLVTGPCIMTGPMCVMISLVCIVTGLMCIKDMDEEALRSADMPFSTPSAAGHECHLSTCKYRRITPDNRGEYIRLALSYRYTQLQTAGSRSYPRPQLRVYSVTHNRVKVIPLPSATGTLSYTQQGWGHTLALSYRYTQLYKTGSRSYPRPQLQVHSVIQNRVEVIPSPSATGTLSYTKQGTRSYPRPQLQVHSVIQNRVEVIPSPSATGTLSYNQQGWGHTLALSYRYTQLYKTGSRSYPRPQLQVHSVTQSRVEVIPSPSATGTLSHTQQGRGHTLALSYRYTQLHTAGSRSYPRPQLQVHTRSYTQQGRGHTLALSYRYTELHTARVEVIHALSYRYTELHTAGSRSYPRPQLQVHSVTHSRVRSYPRPQLGSRYTQLHTAGSRSYPRPQLQVHSVTHSRVEVIPSPSATGTLSYTQQGRGHTLALSYRYTQLHTAGSRSYPRPQLQVHSVTHSRVEVIPSPSATGTLSYTQQGRGHTLALSCRYTQLHTAGSRSYPRPQLQVHSVTHSRVEVIPSPSATGTLSYTQQGRGHTLALSYRYTQLHTAGSRSYPRPQLQVHSVTHSRVEVIPSPSATGTLSYTQQGRGHTLALSYRYTSYTQQGRGHTLAISYRYTSYTQQGRGHTLSYRYTQLYTTESRSYPRPQLQVHSGKLDNCIQLHIINITNGGGIWILIL